MPASVIMKRSPASTDCWSGTRCDFVQSGTIMRLAAVRIQIVLAVVLHHGLRLRMHVGQVVRLVERIDAGLPVRRPFGAHVMHDVHLLDLVILDVAGRQTDRVAQRRRLAVHVHEDDAAEHFATDLAQTGAVLDERRGERVLVADALELAVEAVLPAMKCARELRDAAAVVECDAVTAMAQTL